uniref:Uncharacterized protein n=1 Tax=Schistosoma curassoni TaxID=6186 RepID=A0A183JUI2_9TREM
MRFIFRILLLPNFTSFVNSKHIIFMELATSKKCELWVVPLFFTC